MLPAHQRTRMRFATLARDYGARGDPFYRRGASGADPLARQELSDAQAYWRGAAKLRDQRFLKSRQYDPNVAVKEARESKLSQRFANYWNADMRGMMGDEGERRFASGEYGRARMTLTGTGGPLRTKPIGVQMGDPYAGVPAPAVAAAQNAAAHAGGAPPPHPPAQRLRSKLGSARPTKHPHPSSTACPPTTCPVRQCSRSRGRATCERHTTAGWQHYATHTSTATATQPACTAGSATGRWLQ